MMHDLEPVPPLHALETVAPENRYMLALMLASLASAEAGKPQHLPAEPIYVTLRREYIKGHKLPASALPAWSPKDWDD